MVVLIDESHATNCIACDEMLWPNAAAGNSVSVACALAKIPNEVTTSVSKAAVIQLVCGKNLVLALRTSVLIRCFIKLFLLTALVTANTLTFLYVYLYLYLYFYFYLYVYLY